MADNVSKFPKKPGKGGKKKTVVSPTGETAEVVAPAEFAAAITPERLKELRAQGVLIEEADPFEDLELPPLQPGEQNVGDLEPAEKTVYAQFYQAQAEAEEISRELTALTLEKTGKAIREKTEMEFLRGDVPIDMQDALRYFRLLRRASYLKEMLYWSLGERLGLHDHVIGIRRGGVVVKGRRKW